MSTPRSKSTGSRNILLAEPLVDDFARCFAGVDPDAAEELGASFALPKCVVREPLAELLRSHLAPAAAA